mgnify:CR=1 FL=1|tara:strand:- start:402 stop:632 length:231 start_codon:yes stop_codon:yes gene_type:complete
MEAPMLFDVLLAGVVLLTGFILRRIFALMDKLSTEDKKLHERITWVQTQYVSKKDFDTAVDRIIDCINRLEMKMDK